MSNRMFLALMAMLVVLAADAQISQPMASSQRPLSLKRVAPRLEVKEMQWRAPGTPVRDSESAPQVLKPFYRRPAGAFYCSMIAKNGVGGYSYNTEFVQLKPFADYTLYSWVDGADANTHYFWDVYNQDGERIGFVMASVLTASLTRIFQGMSVTYLLLLLLMSVVGAVLAAAFMQNLRRTLLGYQPEEIIKRYVERTDVLDAMEEGICAIDTSGKIMVLNRMARTILGIDSESDADSKDIRDVFPIEKLLTVAHSNTAQYNVDERIRGSHIMSTRIPIYSQGRLIGAVSIMRDKTELVKMAEELTGANYMVDTLRAVHHEFKNKMHVILGLLEMEQSEKAREYILGTTLVTGEAISNIKKLIPISNLAALLIGKVMRAAELDISLSIKADTHFVDKENGLPSECYITIVGNLVENAIDELNRADFPVKEIELGIYVDEESTIITCDDTGGGIPEDILIHLYDRNTTTKGEGHGIGFSLIRDIVDTYEGVVHIDTEVGAGTSIEITLPI